MEKLDSQLSPQQEDILNKVWNPATPYLLISRLIQLKDLAVIWDKAYFGASSCPLHLTNEQDWLVKVSSNSQDIDIGYVVFLLKEQGVKTYGAIQALTLLEDKADIFFLNKELEGKSLFFYEHELDTLQLTAAIEESKALLLRIWNL